MKFVAEFPEDPFILLYCVNRYKTSKRCDEAVEDCLSALKFVPDWFVTNKMLRKLHEGFFTNYDILSFDEDFGNIEILVIKWVFFLKILIKLILMMLIFMKMTLKLLFISDYCLVVISLKNAKHIKKDISKELMPVACYPTRLWDWCLLEDEKKGIEPIFTDKVGR